MSKHHARYPGLWEACLNGKASVSYYSAYHRMLKGMSFEQAISMPAQLGKKPRLKIEVSQEIRHLRETFCAEFMKTGSFDPVKLAALKEYVQQCRTSH